MHVEIVLISYVRFWMYFKRRNHIVSMKIFISCSSTQNMYLTACCYVSRNNLNYSSVGQHVHSCLSNAILQKSLQHLMHFSRQYFFCLWNSPDVLYFLLTFADKNYIYMQEKKLNPWQKSFHLRSQCLRQLLLSTGDFCLSSYCEQANISFSVETAQSI